MRRRPRFILAGIVVCLVTWAAAAVTLDDFEGILASIPVENEVRIMAALELGLKSNCCGFSANETYRLFERLAGVSGSSAEKETIILVFTRAIERGMPLDSLVSKANEGLARGVSLSSLGQLLQKRLVLLEEASDLLVSRGIFRSSPGVGVTAGATALPASRFDALLSNFGDALGDYLESGGSPFDGERIYSEVQARLTLLGNSVLAANDVELLLSRIEPADLTDLLLAAQS